MSRKSDFRFKGSGFRVRKSNGAAIKSSVAAYMSHLFTAISNSGSDCYCLLGAVSSVIMTVSSLIGSSQDLGRAILDLGRTWFVSVAERFL